MFYTETNRLSYFTVPPSKMSIFDENRIDRTSVVGPYTEGSDLILTCEVYGGKKKLSIMLILQTIIMSKNKCFILTSSVRVNNFSIISALN